jgi:hypothetical protein
VDRRRAGRCGGRARRRPTADRGCGLALVGGAAAGGELGDPVAAASAADAVRLDGLPAQLAERRASYLITVAWVRYLRRRDDEAVQALSEARAHAPEQLLFTRRVSDMLGGMLRRDRRRRRELLSLARFAGVA